MKMDGDRRSDLMAVFTRNPAKGGKTPQKRIGTLGIQSLAKVASASGLRTSDLLLGQ
jgi:hypothetical protein